MSGKLLVTSPLCLCDSCWCFSWCLAMSYPHLHLKYPSLGPQQR